LLFSLANATLKNLRFFETGRNIHRHQRHILYKYTCTERKATASELWTWNLAITNPMRYLFNRDLCFYGVS